MGTYATDYTNMLAQYRQYDTNQWNDNLIRAAAANNQDPLSVYSRASGVSTTLSGRDHELVSKYFAAKGLEPNQEWIRSNESAYWMRQLSDANNWYSSVQQQYANYRNELSTAESRAKQEGLQEYQNAIATQNQAQIDAVKAQNDALIQQMSAQQAEAMASMTQAIEQSNQQYAQMQAQIADQEKQRELSKFLDYGYRGLTGVDPDNYSGEEADFNKYRDFLGQQLGSVGYDGGQLLSKYDITGALQGARSAADPYVQMQQNLLANPESFMQQYGGGDQARAAVEGMYAQAQSGLSNYDNQLRNSLSGLGQAYNAYAVLGDVTQAQGATPQEKVASLFGIRPINTQPTKDVMNANFGAQQGIIDQLSSLYVESGGAPGQVIDPIKQRLTNMTGLFGTAVQGVDNTYLQGVQDLYQGYGNIDQMASGQVFNRANQIGGLLSQGATDLNTLVGQAGTETNQAQQEYDRIGSAMRGARINERAALVAQQAESTANDYRKRQLMSAANTLNRQLLRTNQETAPVYNIDPLGLSRSSLFS